MVAEGAVALLFVGLALGYVLGTDHRSVMGSECEASGCYALTMPGTTYCDGHQYRGRDDGAG